MKDASSNGIIFIELQHEVPAQCLGKDGTVFCHSKCQVSFCFCVNRHGVEATCFARATTVALDESELAAVR